MASTLHCDLAFGELLYQAKLMNRNSVDDYIEITCYATIWILFVLCLEQNILEPFIRMFPSKL